MTAVSCPGAWAERNNDARPGDGGRCGALIQERNREVSRQDGEACAKRLQALFIECSAKTKAGVEQTFEELVQKVRHEAARGCHGAHTASANPKVGWMQGERLSLADAGYAQPLAEDAKEASRRGAHKRQHSRRRRGRRLVLRMLNLY